ncbi:MAG: hypothetical protein P4L85_23565 [Paludisphaera borealis]|uniref:hypothetical protein n=1 Tax=Paludisphaera borealis TaxID=1387353 RepID=UPI00284BC834|nr:hypothetical protein [Paludisphaera borealis]MDR3622349.1 hypothetical protein [Paludisphaera borealis]
MEPYANLGGRSGIEAYETGFDSITVQFGDGTVYVYTNASAGASNVGQMKLLARRGHGLNAFINKSVKFSCDRKWK